jgi:glucokinase
MRKVDMEAANHILGVEIGGTKLQLGVADGQTGELIHTQRDSIDRAAGAEGILAQIARIAPRLRERFGLRAVGIGFGGPVDIRAQRVITSHQVAGWDDFPLIQWCQQTLECPAVFDNDCNVAAFAEARRGAGRGLRRVFYVTVGTGIGGGLVVDGRIDGQQRPAVAEIGHLRPGLQAITPQATVESLASGLAIERAARQRLAATGENSSDQIDLCQRCQGDLDQLTTRQIAAAAQAGNALAAGLIEQAAEVLGWAIAQTITLTAPDRVVLGGGVSLIGASFLQRVRQSVRQFVFPPLADACDLVPAELGELVVVYGAVELARAAPGE